VDLLQVPSGNSRDVEINDQAVPILEDETIQAQTSQIDAVSGATVTGPSLTWADVLATAAFVEGPPALRRVADLPGSDALLVHPDGRLSGTGSAAW